MQKRADDIFTDSQFSAFMKQLETEDFNCLFENSTLSEAFIWARGPESQAGRKLSLEVVLDAHFQTC